MNILELREVSYIYRTQYQRVEALKGISHPLILCTVNIAYFPYTISAGGSPERNQPQL